MVYLEMSKNFSVGCGIHVIWSEDRLKFHEGLGRRIRDTLVPRLPGRFAYQDPQKLDRTGCRSILRGRKPVAKQEQNARKLHNLTIIGAPLPNDVIYYD